MGGGTVGGVLVVSTGVTCVEGFRGWWRWSVCGGGSVSGILLGWRALPVLSCWCRLRTALGVPLY